MILFNKNVINIRENGIENFLEKQEKKWTCYTCNAIISLHNRFCSRCKNLLININGI